MFHQVYIYAGANDLDRAFEWQAKAYDDGASSLYYFSTLIETSTEIHDTAPICVEWACVSRESRTRHVPARLQPRAGDVRPNLTPCELSAVVPSPCP